MFNTGAGHPLIRHSQLKCKFKGSAQQHRPQTVSLVPPSSAADESSGQKNASNSSTEEYMNQALFLSSDEMHRQLNAAKRLRSDFLHAMALGTRRKFVAPNRIVSSLRAAMSRRTVAGLACVSRGRRISFVLGTIHFVRRILASGRDGCGDCTRRHMGNSNGGLHKSSDRQGDG